MEAMKDAEKKTVEDQIGGQALGYLKPCFPCCGGPVGTIEKFICVVPADQQDSVKSAIDKYKAL